MAYWNIGKAIPIAAMIAVAGCAKDNIIPPTQLPDRPASASIPCEPLTKDERAACLRQATEARQVCRKVERNEAICADQQDFVKRLYDARDGK